MPQKPVVSIWMIAYNHEDFIKQAIESVLSQKTNFSYELIIGEDNSTDNTGKIIEEYAKQYPDVIKPVFNKRNLGMMQNMVSTLNRCKGKYIALLEGDDYWTDEMKLQNQVHFLENNSHFSFCFHNALVIDENNSKEPHVFSNISDGQYTGEDIINNWIVPTASVVFRNYDIQWPDFTNNCAHGDILLFLLLLEKGEAYYINETWSVYRKNNSSITLSNTFYIPYIEKIMYQLKKMDSYFFWKYHAAIKKNKIYWNLAFLKSLFTKKKYINFIIKGITFILIYPEYINTKIIRLLSEKERK